MHQDMQWVQYFFNTKRTIKSTIGYYSATLNEAQRNYNIYDLKLLAIVMALKNWRLLLAGSPHKIIIYSDHLNLQYW